MRLQLRPIDAATYQPHPLHADERTWSETNCYVDLWIEVLHALGLDPVPAAACALSADFEGDQWTFLKFPAEDLRSLYGIETLELNVWQPVVDHVADHLTLGRLLTLEVDAWYLPDARASYRQEHVKTTIATQMLDRDDRRLGYFHNAGYFELSGEDFDGVFDAGRKPRAALAPYMEVIKLDRMRGHGEDFVEVVRRLACAHLALRPTSNPVLRFRKQLGTDVPRLAARDLTHFHRYAFGTCRQCGVAADLAASFLHWLDGHDGGLGDAIAHFRSLSTSAKALEFALARVVRGRAVDVDPLLSAMERDWDLAMFDLVARYGG